MDKIIVDGKNHSRYGLVMITRVQCRAARAWFDLTQADLAKLAGINRNSIHTWEMGKSIMHPNNIKAIEGAFKDRGMSFFAGSALHGLRALPPPELVAGLRKP